MLTLPRPNFFPAVVISDCIGGYSNPLLKTKLKAAEASLITAANNYDKLAQTHALHTLPRLNSVGTVSKTELEGLYTDQLSATNGAGRKYYDVIRGAPTNRKCPLCGVGTVTVLDHHLPKSKYPDLAICPFNLVPSCDFCNNAKRARFPTVAGEQTIHPYYDDFTKEQWVFAYLDTAGIPALVFYTNPPISWPSVQRDRAARHFEVVKLGVTFASNANDDMVTLRRSLILIQSRKGPFEVRAYLEEQRDRYNNRLNSWQHVMYQTLSECSQFVNGGYLAIPH
jgi:5-methylcytosine-specific restriction endonuclease McrA